jgi:hypothetical protein
VQLKGGLERGSEAADRAVSPEMAALVDEVQAQVQQATAGAVSDDDDDYDDHDDDDDDDDGGGGDDGDDDDDDRSGSIWFRTHHLHESLITPFHPTHRRTCCLAPLRRFGSRAWASGSIASPARARARPRRRWNRPWARWRF